ncbi:MAG: AAA family ATPase, partial [Thermomicrobiales bacterium]
MPHIASISAHNFRRFTSLSVTNIPTRAKAVILVGPNGSGKTAIFDAIQLWYTMTAQVGHSNDFNYYNKGYTANANGYIPPATVEFHEGYLGNGLSIDGL